MRLIPPGHDWTAYVWLIYLAYFAITPIWAPLSPAWAVAHYAATFAGLVLYVAGQWLTDRRVVLIAAAFVAIGAVMIPFNPVAGVFFVYGGSFLGKALEPGEAYWWLVAILVFILAEAWLAGLPRGTWIGAFVFTLVIGAVMIHDRQRRMLAASLLRAQDEVEQMAKIAERERIARDLHDLLGHTLSTIVLKSELAGRLAATDTGRAIAEIRDVEQISREALAQVRSAVRGYRSAGFASELAEARRTLEAAGVRMETAIDLAQLPPAQEGVLGLVLREAVTNVVRHARATTCRVALGRVDGFCQLEVADNGVGGAGAGNGLRGMRERVEALGGELVREISGGTRLRIRIPA